MGRVQHGFRKKRKGDRVPAFIYVRGCERLPRGGTQAPEPDRTAVLPRQSSRPAALVTSLGELAAAGGGGGQRGG